MNRHPPPLLFAPRVFEASPGNYRVPPSGRFVVRSTARAFGKIDSLFPDLDLIPEVQPAADGVMTFMIGDPGKAPGDARAMLAEVTAGTADRIRDQGFALIIGDRCILAAAYGEEGLVHAAHFIDDLRYGGKEFPCLVAADRPDVDRRCVLLDVSRGRVPRMAWMARFVESIARLRYNQLTLNIEHVAIARDDDPEGESLTPDEFAELVRICRRNLVEYVPFQQSLGHMRGLLRRPEYTELAYDPDRPWSLDPGLHEVYDLLNQAYQIQLKTAESDFFHIGLDEPFDMVKRYDEDRYCGMPFEEIYSIHLKQLRDLLALHGRRLMFWADVVAGRGPSFVSAHVPEGAVLCHWQYGSGNLEGPEFYRQKIGYLQKSDRDFYACACTWSMTKVFPDLAVARANAAGLMPEAKKLPRLIGTMATIWGDMGHSNLGGMELWPLAEIACRSWGPNPPGPDLAEAVGAAFFCDRFGQFATLVRELDKVNSILRGPFGMAGVGFLVFFAEPFSLAPLPPDFDAASAAAELLLAGTAATDALRKMDLSRLPNRELWLDYQVPALMVLHLSDKLDLSARLRQTWPTETGEDAAKVFLDLAERCRGIGTRLQLLFALLEARWLANNKESDLEQNRNRWNRLLYAWLHRENQLREFAEDARRTPGRKHRLETTLAKSPAYVFDPIEEIGLKGLI